ncbi:MAG: ABC transporter permease [Gemmatimonadaceae bacterium]|nr:ABC transporter permease [Gemmatimonadaceae bacterium]
MLRHLTLAARLLARTPFVTTIAVLSLALGIGANAAIFSLFDQILLRPLPVPNPQELINLGAPGPKPGSQSCNQAGDCDVVFSYPMYRDLERQQTVLTGLAGHVAFGVSVAVNNEPASGEGMLVSGSYFPTLQLQPAVGRLLQPADDSIPGAHYVTVISHEFWQDRFGADPQIAGRTMIINGRTFTIVGVAPERFNGTTLGMRPQVYVPLSMRAVVDPGFRADRLEARRTYWVYVFGRRKPGVSLEQATVALNALYRPIITDVEMALQDGMSDQTLQRFREKVLTVEAGPQGQSSTHAEARTPLFMLFGVTGVVLLIACANIANLLLARGAGRAAEMGVRLALGATRRHLLSLLLTESVLLALLGGMVSLVVAQWTLTFIGSLMPADASDSLRFALQPSVVWFTAGLSIGTGVLFGLFPALHSTRDDLIGVIRAGAGQLTGGKAATRFRAALVTVQITLSMALLVSAGLFLKSLLNVSRVELGMDVTPFATFALAPSRAGYDTTRAGVYFARVEDELSNIAGVSAVTSSVVPLLAGSNWGTDVVVQGFADGPDVDDNARFNSVSAGYFRTLGVALRQGRDFSPSDVAGAQRVAIVNEAFARKFNLGPDVVGKFMGQGDSLDTQIIGLIPDIKYSSVKDSVPPLFYTPWRQSTRHSALYFYVKGSLPPEQLLATIRDAVTRIDPTVPVEELRTMTQQIRENVFLDRMISILSAAFAVLATLLAAVGLYGVLAYSVAQRTREIGVRMALGADAAAVRRLVMRQVTLMTAFGAVLGVGVALALGRAARSLLFGLEGHDPLVFALSVVLLAVVALVAGYLPARRAAQVDPMQALRYD